MSGVPPAADPALVFQLDTRATLAAIGSAATLDDLSGERLDALVPAGFGLVWFLGMWRVGEAARAISRADPGVRAERARALPGDDDAAIVGSSFAIAAYEVPDAIGGDAALARLRARLRARGAGLMLDFVPNHTAPDHPWVDAHPERFLRGKEAVLAAEPGAWWRAPGGAILAHGRDPYFPPWPDVLQLDYAHPDTIAAMAAALASVARRCDAVRADMAMLVLPEVFERCWGRRALPFWADAIAGARAVSPGLRMIAEAYWGTGPALRSLGFDAFYDKPFLDAAVAADPGALARLLADPDARAGHTLRFLENHDEARAAAAMPWPQRRAMTALLLASPGMRLLQRGQAEGARIRVSPHLGRHPVEAVDAAGLAFHREAIAALAPAPDGAPFEVLEPMPASEGDPSAAGFVVLRRPGDPALLLAVNAWPERGRCRVRVPGPPGAVALRDLLGPERWTRDGAAMAGEGLFLELPGWGVNLFRIDRADPAP